MQEKCLEDVQMVKNDVLWLLVMLVVVHLWFAIYFCLGENLIENSIKFGGKNITGNSISFQFCNT